MSLLNQSDLEARLGRALTAEEISGFTIINAANQAYVERIIGSSVESAAASTRYYDGGVQHLAIDPCTNVTAVSQVDDDDISIYTYDTSDYSVDPKNKTLKTMIRHRNTNGFIPGINNIAVTAKFSIFADTDTLNIVKNALLEALLSEVESTDNIKRESIEGYSVEYASTETRSALDSIRYLFPRI